MIRIRDNEDFFEVCSTHYGYNELETKVKGKSMRELYTILKALLKRYYSEPIDMQSSFQNPTDKMRYWYHDVVDLRSYGLTWWEGITVLQAVYADCPLLFFSDAYSTGGSLEKCTLIPVVDYEFLRGDFRSFYVQKIEETIKHQISSLHLTTGMTCRDAAKKVYTLIQRSADYDHNKGERIPYVDIPSHSLLNYVRNRSAVCQGIAVTYQAMMNYITIPTITVSGMVNENLHAWNFSYLTDERKWIMVDVTQGVSTKGESGFDIPPSNKVYRPLRDDEKTIPYYKGRPDFTYVWDIYLGA